MHREILNALVRCGALFGNLATIIPVGGVLLSCIRLPRTSRAFFQGRDNGVPVLSGTAGEVQQARKPAAGERARKIRREKEREGESGGRAEPVRTASHYARPMINKSEKQ